MKHILLLFVFLGFSSLLYAQDGKGQSGLIPEELRQYQLNLGKEAKEIKEINYSPTGEPVKGKLAPDGQRVIIDQYRKGTKVSLKVVWADGVEEEIVRSPCYIDPVRYEL